MPQAGLALIESMVIGEPDDLEIVFYEALDVLFAGVKDEALADAGVIAGNRRFEIAEVKIRRTKHIGHRVERCQFALAVDQPGDAA